MNSSYTKVKFGNGDTEKYLCSFEVEFLSECAKLAAQKDKIDTFVVLKKAILLQKDILNK